MNEFKVGDKVRVNCDASEGKVPNGTVGVIKLLGKYKNIHSIIVEAPNGKTEEFRYDELELITSKGNKLMGDTVKQRRTFKLIKETPNLLKGAIYQERCDDGTQPYDLREKNFLKGSKNPGAHHFASRELVEEQPDWFVEVFRVTPEFMTAEELEQWETFKKGSRVAKKVTTKKPATNSAAYWTPERRAARSRQMKKIRKANKDTWGK